MSTFIRLTCAYFYQKIDCKLVILRSLLPMVISENSYVICACSVSMSCTIPRPKIDNRALLTRDRRLLMHGIVRHGYYLRSQKPLEQTIEVLRRFDLFLAFAPFTRCLHCNALLEPVEKGEIIEELEPLTKIYYEQFRRCTGCGQIYWPGSHFDKLLARIEEIRASLTAEFQSENQT